MRRVSGAGVAAAVVFAVSGVARADTVVNLAGSDSIENTGVSFSGKIAYDTSDELVTITLNNTSGFQSVITGFVFNINANVAANYDSSADNLSTVGVDESQWDDATTLSPFGTFGAGSFLVDLSAQQVKGIDEGETGIFEFNLSGPDAALLDFASFTTKLNTGDGLSSFFAARFQSVGADGEDSDKMVAAVVPNVVPLPAAAWGGMALLSAIGGGKLWKRRRDSGDL